MGNSDVQTVILFDSNLSVEDIERFSEKPNAKIISFDYASHKLLTKHGISHEISEYWMDDNEFSKIQKHVYKFSHWYEHPDIKKYLDYDGINLGELVLGDFLYFLPEFITHFIKVRNIYLKNKNSHFFASNQLFGLIKKYNPDSIQLIKKNSKNESKNIKYDLKLFNKNISLKIPTSKYLTFKKNSEKLLNYFFNAKLHNKDNNLLLVNFHTEKYASIFDVTKMNSLQLCVFNTMMPNFWNYETFSTLKKSKCKIIDEPLLSNTVKNNLQSKISELKDKVGNLWGKEDFFESFFIYENIPFWTSFKEYFFRLFEINISNNLIQIEKIKTVLEKNSIKNVLIWSETNPIDIIFLELRTKYGYDVFKLQHGIYPESEVSNDFCKSFKIYGLKSDKYFVWGNSSKSHYLNHGFQDDQIVITGSPIHDPVFQKSKNSLQNDYVLLGTNTPVGIFADELSVPIQHDYENSVKKICEEIIKNNKKLIVKLHPASDQMNLTSLIHEVEPSIPIFSRGELQKLLANCQLYVSTGISTSILDAFAVNKPVINIKSKRHNLGNYDILDYTLNSNPEDFGEYLRKFLGDDLFKNSIMKKQNEYVKKYFSKRGCASSSMLNYVNGNHH